MPVDSFRLDRAHLYTCPAVVALRLIYGRPLADAVLDECA